MPHQRKQAKVDEAGEMWAHRCGCVNDKDNVQFTAIFVDDGRRVAVAGGSHILAHHCRSQMGWLYIKVVVYKGGCIYKVVVYRVVN